MKIYLDLIFLLNLGFDFILLLSVSLLLRRMVPMKRIFLGAFIGGFSIFFLFIDMSSFTLFLLKGIVSILMVLSCFGYKDIKYTIRNLGYLYMASIVLGGFLYFLNVQFSYKQEGMVFFHEGMSINVIFLIIFSPIILYTYVRQGIKLKNHYNHYYQIRLNSGDKKIILTGFLDTGNQLKDPYFNRPILLVTEHVLEVSDKSSFIYIPYDTVGSHGLLRCMKCDEIEIIGVGFKKNILVGLLEEKIGMDGIDCILQERLLEG